MLINGVEYKIAPYANLRGADLHGANLSKVYLGKADLWGANLSKADLSGAGLGRANLFEANLCEANLSWADLSSANLRGADLSGADLRGADLPSPTMMLLAYWERCSNALTASLMRYDAGCHPDINKFVEWANGGECPYSGVQVSRAANFLERKECISKDFAELPNVNPYDLMISLFKEKRIKY